MYIFEPYDSLESFFLITALAWTSGVTLPFFLLSFTKKAKWKHRLAFLGCGIFTLTTVYDLWVVMATDDKDPLYGLGCVLTILTFCATVVACFAACHCKNLWEERLRYAPRAH